VELSLWLYFTLMFFLIIFNIRIHWLGRKSLNWSLYLDKFITTQKFKGKAISNEKYIRLIKAFPVSDAAVFDLTKWRLQDFIDDKESYNEVVEEVNKWMTKH